MRSFLFLILLVGFSREVLAVDFCDELEQGLLAQVKRTNTDTIDAFHTPQDMSNMVTGKKVVVIGPDGVPIKTYVEGRYAKFDPINQTATFEYKLAGIDQRVPLESISSHPLERLKNGNYREFTPPPKAPKPLPAPVAARVTEPVLPKPTVMHGNFSERSLEEYIVVNDKRASLEIERMVPGPKQAGQVEETMNRLFSEDPEAYVRIHLNAQRQIAREIAQQTNRAYSEVEREVMRNTRWRRPASYRPTEGP